MTEKWNTHHFRSTEHTSLRKHLGINPLLTE